jgi:hypothetical protein
LNGSTNAGWVDTSYRASALVTGRTYFFYLTAFNSSNQESPQSQRYTYTVPDPNGMVRFVGSDSVTSGSWKGNYGANGYSIVGDGVMLPVYGNVQFSGSQTRSWATSTTDPAALQKANSSDRVAAALYSASSFDVMLTLSGNNPRDVTLYFLDWDGLNRTQDIEVINRGTGAIVDRRTVSNFSEGVYLNWVVTMPVSFRVRRTGGPDAVVSGVFFDTP